MRPEQTDEAVALLRRAVGEIDEAPQDPFAVLVTTVISLRTRDEVTAVSAERLLQRAPTPRALSMMDESEVAALIFPAGFSRTKAARLVVIARRIAGDHGGRVPDTLPGLLAFDGVGLKTANLVLSRGFGLPAICVDIHVHRISNRWGLVQTRAPDETEPALREVLPRRHWVRINELLVRFGQRICTPLSPRCSICPLTHLCSRAGVTRTR